MRIVRRTRWLCLVAGAVLVAGCGASGGGQSAAGPTAAPTSVTSAPPPAPVAPTASPTTSPTTSPTAGPTAGRPRPTGPARARTSDLSAELAWVEGAAGGRYSSIVLTNRSRRTSTIYGYGGLQLVDVRGRAVPTRQVRDRTTRPTLVVLRPGRSVHADLHWSAIPQSGDSETGTCQPEPTYLLVTPPDEARSLRVRWTGGPVCARGLIYQRPYAPGRPTPAGSVPGAVTAAATTGGGSGEVQLSWTAVVGATGYRVIRTASDGRRLRVVADIDITTGRTTAAAEVANVFSAQHSYVPDRGRLTRADRSATFHYVDVGAGRRYYRVQAYNAVGDGLPSAVTSAAPPGG